MSIWKNMQRMHPGLFESKDLSNLTIQIYFTKRGYLNESI